MIYCSPALILLAIIGIAAVVLVVLKNLKRNKSSESSSDELFNEPVTTFDLYRLDLCGKDVDHFWVMGALRSWIDVTLPTVSATVLAHPCSNSVASPRRLLQRESTESLQFVITTEGDEQDKEMMINKVHSNRFSCYLKGLCALNANANGCHSAQIIIDNEDDRRDCTTNGDDTSVLKDTPTIPAESENEKQIEEEQEERDRELEELREEVKRLRLQNLDTTLYAEWGPDEIAFWILTLDEGRLAEYEETLTRNLREEQVDGSMLDKVDSGDLRAWGVVSFSDRKYLQEQIAKLVDGPDSSADQAEP